MNPIISLIIPTHNEEKYIAATLNKAVLQSFWSISTVPYEIIVVDNCNTDHTVDIAETFEGVRIVKETRPGLTYAREAGRKAAKGRILVYIDADTHIPINFLLRILVGFGFDSLSDGTLIYDASIGGVGVPYDFYDGPRSLRIGCKGFFFVWRIYDSILKALGKPRFLFGPAFAVSAITMQSIGGFDTNIQFYGEDANTTKRVGAVSQTRFLWDTPVGTSSRRYTSMGVLNLCWVYLTNYVSMTLKGKTTNKEYTEL